MNTIIEDISEFLTKMRKGEALLVESAKEPIQLAKPYAESSLHEMTFDALCAKLLESRREQHRIPQFSAAEAAHLKFVDEAVAVLKYKMVSEATKQDLDQVVTESAPNPKKPYGVRYTVFAGKGDRLVTKEHWVETDEKLHKAVENITDLVNFHKIVSYHAPHTLKDSKELDEFVKPEIKHFLVGSSGQNLTNHTSSPHFSSEEAAKSHQEKYKHVPAIKGAKIVRGTADKHGFVTPVKESTEDSLDELSNELLGRYKKASAEASSAADKKGNFDLGNKRYKGIIKATNKQFDNDAKQYKK